MHGTLPTDQTTCRQSHRRQAPAAGVSNEPIPGLLPPSTSDAGQARAPRNGVSSPAALNVAGGVCDRSPPAPAAFGTVALRPSRPVCPQHGLRPSRPVRPQHGLRPSRPVCPQHGCGLQGWFAHNLVCGLQGWFAHKMVCGIQGRFAHKMVCGLQGWFAHKMVCGPLRTESSPGLPPAFPTLFLSLPSRHPPPLDPSTDPPPSLPTPLPPSSLRPAPHHGSLTSLAPLQPLSFSISRFLSSLDFCFDFARSLHEERMVGEGCRVPSLPPSLPCSLPPYTSSIPPSLPSCLPLPPSLHAHLPPSIPHSRAPQPTHNLTPTRTASSKRSASTRPSFQSRRPSRFPSRA